MPGASSVRSQAAAATTPRACPSISLQLFTLLIPRRRPSRFRVAAVKDCLTRATVVAEARYLDDETGRQLATAPTRAKGQGHENLLDSRLSVETVTPGLWEGQQAALLTLECLHLVDVNGCTIEVSLSYPEDESARPRIFAAGPGLWEDDCEIVTKRRTGSLGGNGTEPPQIVKVAPPKLSSKPSTHMGVRFRVQCPSRPVREVPDRFRVGLIFEHNKTVCVEGRLQVNAPLKHKSIRRGESQPKLLRPLFGVNRLPMCCEQNECDAPRCTELTHWQAWVWKHMFANVGLNMNNIPRVATNAAWLIRFGVTPVPLDPEPLQPRPVDQSIPLPYAAVTSRRNGKMAE